MSLASRNDAPAADGPRPEFADLVRGPSMRDLAKVDRAVVARNAAYLAGVWGMAIGAMAVAARRPRWWTIATAAVIVSARQQALLNVEHECIHGTFVPGRSRNDAIGTALCAAPCGSAYRTARSRHLAHHRLLHLPDDPDRELHELAGATTRSSFRRHFATSLLGGYARRSLTGHDHGDQSGTDGVDLRTIGLAQLVLWAATWPLLGWWVYPVLWALPLGTATAFLHQVRSFGEHSLTAEQEASGEHRLITTASNPVERWLVSPFNMNLHAEHHLHPFVPASRLPVVRDRLDGQPGLRTTRRSYFSTMRHHHRSLPR